MHWPARQRAPCTTSALGRLPTSPVFPSRAKPSVSATVRSLLPIRRDISDTKKDWIARDTWFPSIFDDAMASCTAGSMVVSVDDQIAALTSAAPRAPAPCASMGNVASATASASDGLARLRERASSWDSASSTSSVSGLSGFPSVTATPGAGTSAGPTVVTAAETHEPSFTSSGSGASTGSHGSATSKGAAGQAADSGWVSAREL